jgi:hypothetical protein
LFVCFVCLFVCAIMFRTMGLKWQLSHASEAVTETLKLLRDETYLHGKINDSIEAAHA